MKEQCRKFKYSGIIVIKFTFCHILAKSRWSSTSVYLRFMITFKSSFPIESSSNIAKRKIEISLNFSLLENVPDSEPCYKSWNWIIINRPSRFQLPVMSRLWNGITMQYNSRIWYHISVTARTDFSSSIISLDCHAIISRLPLGFERKFSGTRMTIINVLTKDKIDEDNSIIAVTP